MGKSKRTNPIAKELRTDKYRQRREEHIKVRKREQEQKEAQQEIQDYIKARNR